MKRLISECTILSKIQSLVMRAIVLLGSMGNSDCVVVHSLAHVITASWQPSSGTPLYSATKHGMPGLMRALYADCRIAGVRMGIVHPWFAATGIITSELKDLVGHS
jgi:NAD(P)-dependent dehydrogenase (short-subunit alcohol dehydrogenase family)